MIFSVTPQGNKVWFSLEGRTFTLSDLKRAILAASGHKLTSYYLKAKHEPLWEVLEAIEIVSNLRSPATDEVDLMDLIDT